MTNIRKVIFISICFSILMIAHYNCAKEGGSGSGSNTLSVSGVRQRSICSLSVNDSKSNQTASITYQLDVTSSGQINVACKSTSINVPVQCSSDSPWTINYCTPKIVPHPRVITYTCGASTKTFNSTECQTINL